MKRSELKQIIRQVIMEQFAPHGVAETGMLQEKSPPNFPKALHDKLLKQYKGEEEKAYATMWKIFYEKEKGHKKVNEMWTAWENKGLNEVGAQVAYKAEVDTDVYPLSQDEVGEISDKHPAVKIKFLGDAAFGTESGRYSFNISGPSGDVDSLVDELSEKGDGIEFVDASMNETEDQDEEHDETDLSNPEENREVELANKIKSLADELLSMHGVEGGESVEGGEDQAAGDIELTAGDDSEETEEIQ